MTIKKNYYICLRFKDRPELHMTVRYLKNLAPALMAEVIEIVNRVMTFRTDKFIALFDLEGWYGPRHTVRVLQARTKHPWPAWMDTLRQALPDTGQDYAFHPHVSTKDDDRLELSVIAVSLMCKKVEVARWDLD